MKLETNLFDIWKDYYAKSSSFFDETIKENFPAQGIAQVLEMNLMYKKLIDESTEKYLELVNLPSRNDLANLSSLVVNVDAKVDNLEELLEDNSTNQLDQSGFKQELSTIKKDMKNLDTKMNQIITLLKAEGSK
ncbi:polyhydroxyalkanoic acid synthase subunit PhaR [Neobacillus vireti]|uniref:polyhydroxyalkanoic acid synthase subunit PhaR n=1 Tax=Neobacillus vireti TaxID=220686 RepID=UPI002FFD62A7